jgi:glucose-6-phosphate 1-dehydrogenase
MSAAPHSDALVFFGATGDLASSIFRIDHYLGMEPVQNLLYFRFANSAAVRLRLDTWRWAGVPFLIRAGKSMAVHAVEIRVDFKRPPRDLFGEHAAVSDYLRVRVGPGVTVLARGLRVKRPGEEMVGHEIEQVACENPAGDMLPYERLLGDAMRGNASLFGREDTIDAQWRIVDPVLDLPTAPFSYEPGSWGPVEAGRLVAGIRGGWHKPVDPNERSPS